MEPWRKRTVSDRKGQHRLRFQGGEPCGAADEARTERRRHEASEPGDRDVPRLRSRLVEPRGNSLWAWRGGVSLCRRAGCRTFGPRQLAGSKPADLAERTRLLRASALTCRSATRGCQYPGESYCVARLGKIVEKFSWPLVKRCVPREGEASEPRITRMRKKRKRE